MHEPITLAQLRSNTRGRATWLVFEPSADSPLRGIERVRLSKLGALLTPRKVREHRLSLDAASGVLTATWTRHDGGKGRLVFRDSLVPRLRGCGPARFQSFSVWDPKKIGTGRRTRATVGT